MSSGLVSSRCYRVPRASSRLFRDHRQVLEGIAYRYRLSCAWRDVPKMYGPWQTLWKRHARSSRDGTWDRIHVHLLVVRL